MEKMTQYLKLAIQSYHEGDHSLMLDYLSYAVDVAPDSHKARIYDVYLTLLEAYSFN